MIIFNCLLSIRTETGILYITLLSTKLEMSLIASHGYYLTSFLSKRCLKKLGVGSRRRHEWPHCLLFYMDTRNILFDRCLKPPIPKNKNLASKDLLVLVSKHSHSSKWRFLMINCIHITLWQMPMPLLQDPSSLNSVFDR